MLPLIPGPFQILIILVFIIVPFLIPAFIGRYVASQKGRSKTEGFLFGLFLSLIGIIIVALLPSKKD